EEPIYRSWREVYEEHGEDLPFDRWVQTVGTADSFFQPQRNLEERLGRPLTEEVLTRRKDRRTALILSNQVLPGVVQRIDEARTMGLKLGVASSSTQEWVTGHLARLGILDRFDCVRCRDDVAHAKPEPDLFLAAAACLGVEPGESIAVEDSPNGVAAAKRAGMKCVAIPNLITARLDLSQADLILDSLADMTVGQLLERLSATA
ncbi:MAG TPA: HAD-IA family hydrolase, partial [Candidatus Dormibacteraeota bacterium]|nr:HAD-IA family hydrolase [Candidatus Dormibacteraeota bacterium]